MQGVEWKDYAGLLLGDFHDQLKSPEKLVLTLD